MDELKRCPFCGEKAVIRTFPGKVFDCYKVYCSNICCYICPVTRIYHNKKEAIEAWNRRADDGTLDR